MTVQRLFAIYDDRAEAYMPPICFLTIGQAERWFGDLMRGDGELSKHPEHYKLMFLGNYDAGSGVIEPQLDGPRFLMDGINAKGAE